MDESSRRFGAILFRLEKIDEQRNALHDEKRSLHEEMAAMSGIKIGDTLDLDGTAVVVNTIGSTYYVDDDERVYLLVWGTCFPLIRLGQPGQDEPPRQWTKVIQDISIPKVRPDDL